MHVTNCETFSGAEYVCVAESTDKDDALERVQTCCPSLQVMHIHVPHFEPGHQQRSGHLAITVTSFLADHGHTRHHNYTDHVNIQCIFITSSRTINDG